MGIEWLSLRVRIISKFTLVFQEGNWKFRIIKINKKKKSLTTYKTFRKRKGKLARLKLTNS